jgi:tellurite resistance protein TehA-like permease
VNLLVAQTFIALLVHNLSFFRSDSIVTKTISYVLLVRPSAYISASPHCTDFHGIMRILRVFMKIGPENPKFG